jgi:hypothetical protein
VIAGDDVAGHDAVVEAGFAAEKDAQRGSAGCSLRVTPDVLENQPFGLLFDGTKTSAQSRALRTEFVQRWPSRI